MVLVLQTGLCTHCKPGTISAEAQTPKVKGPRRPKCAICQNASRPFKCHLWEVDLDQLSKEKQIVKFIKSDDMILIEYDF